MKAVVLVGGEGTRLRPLTETTPKPLIPVMDRRFLDHVLDQLARHGVDEVVLSSPYLEETFRSFIDSRRDDLPAVHVDHRGEPLGTGGAVVNALDHLGDDDLVLRAERRHPHRPRPDRACSRSTAQRGASVTISLTHVEDARPFGLVLDRGRRPRARVPGEAGRARSPAT